MTIQSTCLGFPRVGVQRELKRALERFWRGAISADELLDVAAQLRATHWRAMKERGIDQIPSNDFALYDQMLDMAVAVGAIPPRYAAIEDPLTRYFAMARGLQDDAHDLPALEMTKWFDTNYHYIVPELAQTQQYTLNAEKIFAELEEARALGVQPRPVVIGPVTFLLLSKLAPDAAEGASTLDTLGALLPVYEQLFAELHARGVQWVQLDEPCLVTDLDDAAVAAYRKALATIAGWSNRPKLALTTYFAELGDNLAHAANAGLDALHIDLVRAPQQLDAVLDALGESTALSLGLVDGRNIWRTDLDAAHATLNAAVAKLGAERVFVGPSCSLLHVPVDLTVEDKLDDELKSWLAFATQKLDELQLLAEHAGAQLAGAAVDQARAAVRARATSARTHNAAVRDRAAAVTPAMYDRDSAFAVRSSAQQAKYNLPLFPTTTIGSFPQTSDIRAARAAWRKGDLTDAEYDDFLRAETRNCVTRQEEIGLDVLVHGEFERNDMVEYFGEQLDGFAFTRNGWVQSYGSRCVKPPVIYGDVSRPEPMTVQWSVFAQSLTQRPMKGMLTGPVTVLQWSFVRDDQPRSETCKQLALALRDEVDDLQKNGIGMIQVDEPALREGLPLRRGEWADYLQWAVDAFRLATAAADDATQIHTHMCYSEFGDILDSIARLDADVLSIETSRSKLELLEDFAKFEYPNAVGPGVYDIHSPRVPEESELLALLERALTVLPAQQLWVNPDCGLKTRGWDEVTPALRRMVSAAHALRTA